MKPRTLPTSLLCLWLALSLPIGLEARSAGNNKNKNSNQKKAQNSKANQNFGSRFNNSKNPITGSSIRSSNNNANRNQNANRSNNNKSNANRNSNNNNRNSNANRSNNNSNANRNNSNQAKNNSNQNRNSNNNKNRNTTARPNNTASTNFGTRFNNSNWVTYPKQVTKPSSNANKNQNQNKNKNNQWSNKNRNHHVTHPNRVHNVITNPHTIHHRDHWDDRWTHPYSVWNPNAPYPHRNEPVRINPNFSNSLNYAYRPDAWGGRPWWECENRHDWHHGSWNYGWNDRYQQRHYRPEPYPHYPPGYSPPRSSSSLSKILPWGIAAWSLGKLLFDSGYSSYRNPYEAPPVETRTQVYRYTDPVTVIGSESAPESEAIAQDTEERSEAAFAIARDLFKRRDYPGSLEAADEAISYEPGDPSLHEFRALALFALGRFGDAAGVLNPVLASGPGWDWTTMIGFYSSSDSYTDQLRRLETYTEENPYSPDPHFLLGYHYLVAGYLPESLWMFEQVVDLEPNDVVAQQLRDLVDSSIPSDGETEVFESESSGTISYLAPEEIEGTWIAYSANDQPITLSLRPDGTFSWNYAGSDSGEVLSGEWAIDEDGRLVLDGSDAQLVGDITLQDNGFLNFILTGAPEGDPGLRFRRQ
ncbi:MAG: tetratricopeptide repeat protein [Verrucomicrobiota bacterium]